MAGNQVRSWPGSSLIPRIPPKQMGGFRLTNGWFPLDSPYLNQYEQRARFGTPAPFGGLAGFTLVQNGSSAKPPRPNGELSPRVAALEKTYRRVPGYLLGHPQHGLNLNDLSQIG